MAQRRLVTTACMVLAGLLSGVPGTGLGVDAFAQTQAHHPPTHPPHRRPPLLPPPQIILPMPPRHPIPHEVELTSVDVRIEIIDQIATTTLDLALTNPTHAPLEAQLVLPVPDGVAIRSLQWDGTGSEPNAEILTREEARRIYEGIVRSKKDPALVEFVGMNLIQSSVFPVPPRSTQHLRLTYEQVLEHEGGRIEYVLPRSEALAEGGVKWSISADWRSKAPLATVYSASHDMMQERLGPGHVRVRLEKNAGSHRGSFRLAGVVPRRGESFATTVFAYPSTEPELRGGGYFMILAAPASEGRREPRQPRELTIVLDRSGSMRGEKFEQVRSAALEVVRGLDGGEFFNIVDYSDSIAAFADGPVARTAATLKEAEAYIQSLAPNGGTNIHDALLEALRPTPREGSVGIVLFLTDGLATVGERSERKIRDLAAAKAAGRRIFTFGVGFDVNAPLLGAIAKGSRGATTFVLPEEDVEVKVSQVFRRLQGPVLTTPVLAGIDGDGGISVRMIREQMPAELPDVFEGDQVVILGRYIGDKPVRTVLSGKTFGKDRDMEIVIDPAGATTRHGFVPRLWAIRKVAALVDEVRLAGADGQRMEETRLRELTDEIVRLSKAWGVLTEYTAFLSREDADFGRGLSSLREPARERLERRAMLSRDQAEGAAQQMDSAAKGGSSNASNGNRYVVAGVPGKIEERTVESVQYFGDKAFFNRRHRWVDASILEEEGKAPDEIIEFASPRYFTLAEELQLENRQTVLSQLGEIYFRHQNRRVLVKGPE